MKAVQAEAGRRTEGDDLSVETRPPDGGDPLLDPLRTDEVALREKENGRDAGLANHDLIAFEASDVEINIAPLDNEGDLSVFPRRGGAPFFEPSIEPEVLEFHGGLARLWAESS